MGKTKKHTKKHTRENLLSDTKKIERDKINALESDKMFDDDRICGSHIKLFNDLCVEYPNTNIESPLFITDNLALMTVRLEYYKLTMQDAIEEEEGEESMTDNFIAMVTNNNYVTYVETVINHVKSLP
jgi:hypothetical protein